MLVIRLAELSHDKDYQGKDDKDIIIGILKDLITLIEDDFKYKKLYNQERTTEYKVHKKIEPELYLELVKIYLSKTDTTKPQNITKAKILVDYLLNNMKSDSMNPKAIQYMSKIKEDLCKSTDMKQPDIDDIINEIQQYIEEIQTAQAIKNEK